MKRTPSRKRPCRICRRWFLPHPRLKDRQMTCGDPTCQKQWHKKKCARWNKNNAAYFKEIYLDKKLKKAAAHSVDTENPLHRQKPHPYSAPPVKTQLPTLVIQEVIGIQELIIIEYIIKLSLKRFQEVILHQLVVNFKDIHQLPPNGRSRGDRLIASG